MNKIAVYYIATNKYVLFFDDFIKGLSHFFPGTTKKVVFITDCDGIEVSKQEDIEIEKHHIEHNWWPIPCILKEHYIEKFFAEDCDYHFYFNANLIMKNDLCFSSDYDMYFNPHYYSDKLSFCIINSGNNNNCIIPPSWAKCHISKSEIPSGAKYCQACFFGGRSEKMKNLLASVNEMTREDLRYNIIPIWHDETYVNRYILDNYWKCNNIGDVKLVKIYDYAELLDKGKFFNKFDLKS